MYITSVKSTLWRNTQILDKFGQYSQQEWLCHQSLLRVGGTLTGLHECLCHQTSPSLSMSSSLFWSGSVLLFCLRGQGSTPLCILIFISFQVHFANFQAPRDKMWQVWPVGTISPTKCCSLASVVPSEATNFSWILYFGDHLLLTSGPSDLRLNF